MVRSWIRTVAIVLIAFPEPVSTAVGITLLLATFALPKQKSLNRFGNMEELVKMSLRNEYPAEFNTWIQIKKPIIFHELKKRLPSQDVLIPTKPENLKKLKLNLPASIHGIGGSNSDFAKGCNKGTNNEQVSFQHQDWFDNRKVSEKVLHHTLKTSFPQYEAMPPVSQAEKSKVHQHKTNCPECLNIAANKKMNLAKCKL